MHMINETKLKHLNHYNMRVINRIKNYINVTNKVFVLLLIESYLGWGLSTLKYVLPSNLKVREVIGNSKL